MAIQARGTKSLEQAAVVGLASLLLRSLIASRRSVGGLLNGAQLRLRAVQARHDPLADEWVRTMKAAVASGAIRREIEQQRPAEEIVAEWRRSAAV
jgi:hypothetical protein